jgi:hypothetical protein
MAQQESYSSGKFKLEIGNESAGYLKKFSGLAIEADIATNDVAGVEISQTKVHVNQKYTPGKMSIGIAMGHGMYEWMQAAFDLKYLRKDGSFISADFNHKAMTRKDFTRALITSITVPKVSGDSKDSCYFDIEFQPEQVKWLKGDGSDIRSKIGPKQKAWIASMFRFEMGSLPCTRVASVDSFTFKCSTTQDATGHFRDPTYHPAKQTIPEVKVSVSMADYEPWANAAKAWFQEGNTLVKNEMQGRLVFLGPDAKAEIGEIEFHNCGFKKFSDQDFETNAEKLARFDVEFYVEKMKFKIKEYDSAS